jgi:hypothetical protein
MEFRINFSERKDEHSQAAESRSKYPGKALLAYCEERFSELKTEQIGIIKSGENKKR